MDQPESPQKKPYVLDESPGKKAWCACGLSQKQPFCDGSHKGTEFLPIVVEVKKKEKWPGAAASKAAENLSVTAPIPSCRPQVSCYRSLGAGYARGN